MTHYYCKMAHLDLLFPKNLQLTSIALKKRDLFFY